MTRKHFQDIADELYNHKPKYKIGKSLTNWEDCVRAMANVCLKHNEDFKRDKFYRRCGYV